MQWLVSADKHNSPVSHCDSIFVGSLNQMILAAPVHIFCPVSCNWTDPCVHVSLAHQLALCWCIVAVEWPQGVGTGYSGYTHRTLAPGSSGYQHCRGRHTLQTLQRCRTPGKLGINKVMQCWTQTGQGMQQCSIFYNINNNRQTPEVLVPWTRPEQVND